MDVKPFIDGLEKKAAQSIPKEQGDYYDEEGLLVCGKCNTRKQGRFRMPWGEVTPFLLCKCGQEKRDREEEEEKRRKFEQTVRKLRQSGFPESDMEGWTFENDDGSNAKLSRVARNYVENFEQMKAKGKGLLFFGTVGTGKTYAAACIANALIDKGYPCIMMRFADIAQGIFDGKFTYHDFNKYPLIVLDDLGAERKTEYMQEIVYNVIDTRYRARLPLIVTTNYTGAELKNPAETTNKRTFSRLLEMCLPVEVSGKDRRRDRLKEDFDEFKDLLGL